VVSATNSPALEVAVEAEALRERGLAAIVGPPPIVLEIGFGRAELVIDLARTQPERRFLGLEVSRKRVVKAARRVERAELVNLKLVHGPAEYLLERVLQPASIAECWINFPDPWPKKRHFKRRLFQPATVARLARVLEPGALLHAATDHMGYAEWIDEILSKVPEIENTHAPAAWSDERPGRRETGYEAEWLAEGRHIAYFDYRRR
jgi:tRNA (guanine-N7-)-methyltransferase